MNCQLTLTQKFLNAKTYIYFDKKTLCGIFDDNVVSVINYHFSTNLPVTTDLPYAQEKRIKNYTLPHVLAEGMPSCNRTLHGVYATFIFAAFQLQAQANKKKISHKKTTSN